MFHLLLNTNLIYFWCKRLTFLVFNSFFKNFSCDLMFNYLFFNDFFFDHFFLRRIIFKNLNHNYSGNHNFTPKFQILTSSYISQIDFCTGRIFLDKFYYNKFNKNRRSRYFFFIIFSFLFLLNLFLFFDFFFFKNIIPLKRDEYFNLMFRVKKFFFIKKKLYFFYIKKIFKNLCIKKKKFRSVFFFKNRRLYSRYVLSYSRKFFIY